MSQDFREEELELVATRVLPTAVRGCAPGKGPITYRRSLDHVIPGHLLVIEPTRRWTFRKTEMVGGELKHVGFSLRALEEAGFPLPQVEEPDGLSEPAAGQAGLGDGLLAMSEEDWLGARGELLAVLEETPTSIGAHCGLGHLHAALRLSTLSLAHYTAAIRLGLTALGREPPQLDPTRMAASSLLGALAGRAQLLVRLKRPEAAAVDLRRALRLDSTDLVGAGGLLGRLDQRRNE